MKNRVHVYSAPGFCDHFCALKINSFATFITTTTNNTNNIATMDANAILAFVEENSRKMDIVAKTNSIIEHSFNTYRYDTTTTKMTVSTYDKYAMQPIRYPMRGIHCKHLQCFEGLAHITKHLADMCPNCKLCDYPKCDDRNMRRYFEAKYVLLDMSKEVAEAYLSGSGRNVPGLSLVSRGLLSTSGINVQASTSGTKDQPSTSSINFQASTSGINVQPSTSGTNADAQSNRAKTTKHKAAKEAVFAVPKPKRASKGKASKAASSSTPIPIAKDCAGVEAEAASSSEAAPRMTAVDFASRIWGKFCNACYLVFCPICGQQANINELYLDERFNRWLWTVPRYTDRFALTRNPKDKDEMARRYRHPLPLILVTRDGKDVLL